MAIGVINGNVIGGCNSAIVAQTYDESKSYAVGDFCLHNYKLYRCIANATGAWQASKWELTDVGEEVKDANSLKSWIPSMARSNGILSDALIVDTANKDGSWNKPMIVDRASTASMPDDCAWGVRTVEWFAQNAVIVKIFGVKTDGKSTGLWINGYWNNARDGYANWIGWTKADTSEAFLTATLAAGETSLTFTSPLIKSTSLIDPYYFAESGATVAPISFSDCTVNEGSLTMTFDAQDQALTIGIKISEV